jgi:hypothetical protein
MRHYHLTIDHTATQRTAFAIAVAVCLIQLRAESQLARFLSNKLTHVFSHSIKSTASH